MSRPPTRVLTQRLIKGLPTAGLGELAALALQTYPADLLWNPPQGYPTDRDWHLTDYKEFGT